MMRAIFVRRDASTIWEGSHLDQNRSGPTDPAAALVRKLGMYGLALVCARLRGSDPANGLVDTTSVYRTARKILRLFGKVCALSQRPKRSLRLHETGSSQVLRKLLARREGFEPPTLVSTPDARKP